MRVLIIVVVFVAMVSISKRLRMQIIKEHARTNNIADAARSVGVSYSTAKRWVARSNSAYGVEDLPRKGRPRVLDEAAELNALEALLSPTLEGADNVVGSCISCITHPRRSAGKPSPGLPGGQRSARTQHCQCSEGSPRASCQPNINTSVWCLQHNISTRTGDMSCSLTGNTSASGVQRRRISRWFGLGEVRSSRSPKRRIHAV